MPIHLKITTDNPSKTNDGGYHELYSARFLSSPEHAFATVESIITNNRIYGDEECELTRVDVYCNDESTYQYLRKQYLYSGTVSVIKIEGE